MNILVKLHGGLKESTGTDSVQVTVEEKKGAPVFLSLLKKLMAMDRIGMVIINAITGDEFKNASMDALDWTQLQPGVIILLNDADIRLSGGLEAPLKEGDVITFLPIIHGG
ncbi:hypothetical protein GF325_05120 [Candidatus Bathyarchaeota archaeon]|nr:hypothetical protein [Candidatus Bathyarchaeota archaeon]